VHISMRLMHGADSTSTAYRIRVLIFGNHHQLGRIRPPLHHQHRQLYRLHPLARLRECLRHQEMVQHHNRGITWRLALSITLPGAPIHHRQLRRLQPPIRHRLRPRQQTTVQHHKQRILVHLTSSISLPGALIHHRQHPCHQKTLQHHRFRQGAVQMSKQVGMKPATKPYSLSGAGAGRCERAVGDAYGPRSRCIASQAQQRWL